MALKLKIAKLEDVAEALRTEYKKAPDGEEGYVLDTAEPVVKKDKLDEFRNNNINLQKALDALKDVDPAKYRELVQLENQVKAGELIKAGKLEEAVNLRVDAMKTELEGKLTESNSNLTKANHQLYSLIINDTVKSAAIKAGVLPSAVDDVIHRARTIYVVEGGVPVPKEGANVIFGKDGKTPMQPEEWVGGLKEKAPHLFQGSQGSGANGGNQPGSKNTAGMTPTEKINAGLAAGGLLGTLPGAAKA